MNARERIVVPRIADDAPDFITRPIGGDFAVGAYLSVSQLYRPENYVPTVVGEAVSSYQVRNPGRPFTVLSVGCSFGAEVDTVLSEVTQAPGIGSIVIRGYDIHEGILEQARAAAYDISTADGTELLSQFELSSREPRQGEDVYSMYQLYVARSGGLRAKHDVDFGSINLAKQSASDEVPEADLVLCNRVLEHMNFREIEPLVRGMASHVAPGGMLSVGTYSNYAEDMTADLIQGLGLEPHLWYKVFSEEPFVFQRPPITTLS